MSVEAHSISYWRRLLVYYLVRWQHQAFFLDAPVYHKLLGNIWICQNNISSYLMCNSFKGFLMDIIPIPRGLVCLLFLGRFCYTKLTNKVSEGCKYSCPFLLDILIKLNYTKYPTQLLYVRKRMQYKNGWHFSSLWFNVILSQSVS